MLPCMLWRLYLVLPAFIFAVLNNSILSVHMVSSLMITFLRLLTQIHEAAQALAWRRLGHHSPIVKLSSLWKLLFLTFVSEFSSHYLFMKGPSPLPHCRNFEESLDLVESLWKSEWGKLNMSLLLRQSFKKLSCCFHGREFLQCFPYQKFQSGTS